MSAATAAVRRGTSARWARRLHPVAGGLALLSVAGLLATVAAVELSGSAEALIATRVRLPWVLVVLVPAMAATALSGARVAGRRRDPRVAAKRRRARWAAANGLLVLVPAVLWLAWKAGRGELDAGFAAVQGLELVAGLVNLVLLGASARDGLSLSAGRRVGTDGGPLATGAAR